MPLFTREQRAAVATRACRREPKDTRDYQAKSSHDHSSIYGESDGIDSSRIPCNAMVREYRNFSTSGHEGSGYDRRDYDSRDYDRSRYDDNSSRNESETNIAEKPNPHVLHSHYEPRSRMNHDGMYNTGINISMRAIDIIVIGFHFSLSGYSKPAIPITELLIRTFGEDVGDFDSPEGNEVNYKAWLEHDTDGGPTFWAFQRDPSKSIHDVEDPKGWRNLDLLEDCETKVGLEHYRRKLLRKDPGGWSHLGEETRGRSRC